MRRITLALMSTLAAVVMLFNYRTSTLTPPSLATTTVAAGSGSSATGTTVPAAPSPSASPTTGTTTVTGQAAQTRWGPVQVQITVADGRVTAVTLLQVPSENRRDVQINNAAVPVLTQETLQAQSAQIDTVSGATVTSDGYITSLQSALDQAGL